MASFKVSYQWLPVFDKYRYRPLPVSADFLQNVVDIIFLLIFIWYWNWGPLLVILYYIIETVVMCLFTALKWWNSRAQLSEDIRVSTRTFKVSVILTLCLVVGAFSYGQVAALHDVLGLVMAWPSWEVVVADKQQFTIGIVAIVLQQTMEYYKYRMQSKNGEVEWIAYDMTPVLRIFVQQFAVLLGILTLLLVSFIDLKVASVMIALLLGGIKLVMGQFQLVVKNKE